MCSTLISSVLPRLKITVEPVQTRIYVGYSLKQSLCHVRVLPHGSGHGQVGRVVSNNGLATVCGNEYMLSMSMSMRYEFSSCVHKTKHV